MSRQFQRKPRRIRLAQICSAVTAVQLIWQKLAKPGSRRIGLRNTRVAADKLSTQVRGASPKRAVVDSGPLLALFNSSDKWHVPVLQWLRANQHVRLIATWSVLTEVCALLARRLGNEAALDFLRWVQRGAIELDRTELSTLDDVITISERFADLPFDLADASVAEAAARLRINSVLTIDSDFAVYRDSNGRQLRNLLASIEAR